MQDLQTAFAHCVSALPLANERDEGRLVCKVKPTLSLSSSERRVRNWSWMFRVYRVMPSSHVGGVGVLATVTDVEKDANTERKTLASSDSKKLSPSRSGDRGGGNGGNGGIVYLEDVLARKVPGLQDDDVLPIRVQDEGEDGNLLMGWIRFKRDCGLTADELQERIGSGRDVADFIEA